MAQLFYNTKRNYKPGSGRESSKLPSQTVPGQSRTMKEILDRYKRGLEIRESDSIYFDSEDIERVNKFFAPGSLDLTDLDELNRHVSNLNSLVDEANKKRQKAHEAEQLAKKEDEIYRKKKAEEEAKKQSKKEEE